MLPGTWRHGAAGTLVTTLQGFGQQPTVVGVATFGFFTSLCSSSGRSGRTVCEIELLL